MAKGRRKNKGAAANAEAFRALEARKRVETVEGLAADVVRAAFGFFASHTDPADLPYVDGDTPEDGLAESARRVTRTIEGTLVLDPDDGAQAAALAELGRLADANGGTVTFGPGEFTIEGHGGPDGVNDFDDFDDDEDFEDDDPDGVDPFDDTLPERVLDHSLADEAMSHAMSILTERMGFLAVPFLGSVIDQASSLLWTVHRGRVVRDGDEAPYGSRDFDAELFAIPYAGPAREVAAALGTALADGSLAEALSRTGAVAPGSRVALFPTPVPMDALCRIGVRAARSAVRQPCHAWSSVLGTAEPDLTALGAALGGVLPATLADAGDFVAGAVVGVRMLPPGGREIDWLGGREPADGEPDPGAAWEAWTGLAFDGTGLHVDLPAAVGTAPSDAAALLLETVFQAANVALDMEPDAFPDRLLVLEEDEAMTIVALHDDRRRIVGPFTLPMAAVERDPEHIDHALGVICATDETHTEDRAEFDAILAEAREAYAAPRDGEMAPPLPESLPAPAATGTPAVDNVVAFRPRPVA